MQQPKWVSIVLVLAAVHCLLWGVFIIAFPQNSFRVYGFAAGLQHPLLWRGSGLTICLFGVGYALAVTDPVRHYGLILVGLLAKFCGALGLIWGWASGALLLHVLFWVLVNDVIWLVPLAVIVRRACKSGIE